MFPKVEKINTVFPLQRKHYSGLESSGGSHTNQQGIVIHTDGQDLNSCLDLGSDVSDLKLLGPQLDTSPR